MFIYKFYFYLTFHQEFRVACIALPVPIFLVYFTFSDKLNLLSQIPQ